MHKGRYPLCCQCYNCLLFHQTNTVHYNNAIAMFQKWCHTGRNSHILVTLQRIPQNIGYSDTHNCHHHNVFLVHSPDYLHTLKRLNNYSTSMRHNGTYRIGDLKRSRQSWAFSCVAGSQIRGRNWKLFSYFSTKSYVVGTQKNRHKTHV